MRPGRSYPRPVLPDWLLWLLPVPLATAGAVAWAAWRGRSRGPLDTAQGVAAYERFRAAIVRRARRRRGR